MKALLKSLINAVFELVKSVDELNNHLQSIDWEIEEIKSLIKEYVNDSNNQ